MHVAKEVHYYLVLLHKCGSQVINQMLPWWLNWQIIRLQIEKTTWIPESGTSTGERIGYPLQYS